MSIPVIIGACVSFASLLAYVVKISMSYSKMKENLSDAQKDLTKLDDTIGKTSNELSTLKIVLESNSKRDEEERIKTAKKFDELYASKNKTNEVLAELSTTIKMMVSNFDTQFKNLDKKIDELKRG